MPYITDLAVEWQNVLNSTVITDPVLVEVIYDPDGDNRDLTDYLVSFGSIKQAKSIYPDDRLNSWSIVDVSCQFNNLSGYFDPKRSTDDTERWVSLLDVYGKKVQVRLVCDACVTKLDMGVFYAYSIPTIDNFGNANWTLSSREKEFAQKNLYANSTRIYIPGSIMPNIWGTSNNYEGITRELPEVFDWTDTADGSFVTNLERGYFPWGVIGENCPLGQWTIEFIEGIDGYGDYSGASESIQNLYKSFYSWEIDSFGAPDDNQIWFTGGEDFDQFAPYTRYIYFITSGKILIDDGGGNPIPLDLKKPYYISSYYWSGGTFWFKIQGIKFIDIPNGTRVTPAVDGYTRKYELTSPDGIKTVHSGDWFAIDSFDTVQSITKTFWQEEEDKLLLLPDYRIESVSGDVITFAVDPEFYSVTAEVEIIGTGSMSGIIPGETQTATYGPASNQITLSGLTLSDLSGDLYVRLSESDYISDVAANYNFARTFVDFSKVRLVIPKIKAGYYFKEGDVITFYSSFIPKPKVDNDKHIIGESVFSLLTSTGYLIDGESDTFGTPAGGLDDTESTANVDIEWTSLETVNQAHGFINVPMAFTEEISVWKAIEVLCKHFNITMHVTRDGKYAVSEYIPKINDLIKVLNDYDCVVSTTVSTLDYFNSVRLNYDYNIQTSQFESKMIVNADNASTTRAKEPILDLWCPAFRSGITPLSIMNGICRHYLAIWAGGLPVYELTLKWNLAIQLSVDELFDLFSDFPEIATRIEIFEQETQINSDSRLVKIKAFDSQLVFNQYAFTNIDYTNDPNKVTW